MIATELVNQLHGNAVLQGETLMMLRNTLLSGTACPDGQSDQVAQAVRSNNSSSRRYIPGFLMG